MEAPPCVELPGLGLIDLFAAFAVELVLIPPKIIAGEIGFPTPQVLFDIVTEIGIEIGISIPTLELPSLGISADIDLEIPGVEPEIAFQIGLDVALACGNVFKALFIDFPIALIEAIIDVDIPELPEFIAEFLIPVMEYDAAITLAGCIAEVVPV